jgi:MFS family permease
LAANAPAEQSSSLPFYYGWLVLAASAAAELLITGATSYSAGLFVLPLQAEFGLSRANASSPVLILFLGGAILSPVAGRMLDRFPIRPVMIVGALCFCGALAFIATSSSLGLMALALLLPAALGYLVLSFLNTTTLASRWFFRRRGLALGIAAVATSGGGFITPLMSWAIRHDGWRAALFYEAGVLCLIILLLAILLVRDSPAVMGLAQHPENAGRGGLHALSEPVEKRSGGLGQELRRWGMILGSRGFWAPSLVVASMAGISQAIVTAAVPYGTQLGFAASAALLVTGFSIAAAITKIAAGIFSDRMNRKLLLFSATICMIAALALLSFVPTFPALLAACCLSGVALGGALPTSAALIAARFGSARFGATMGWAYFLFGTSTIAAVRISGTIYDHTGSYHAGFLIFLVFCTILLVATLLLEAAPIDDAA